MTTPEPRRSQPDKPRLWGSLRRKMSGSGKRNSNDHQLDNGGGNRSSQLHPNRKELLQQAATRLARRKSEKSGRSARGSGPVCSKARTNQSPKSVALPVFCSCSNSQQRFAPLLDDDTFSTRPLIGITTGFDHHYSEIWLADYIESTRNNTSFDESASGASPKQDTADVAANEHSVATQERLKNLRSEIHRLTRALSHVSVHHDPLLGRRIDHDRRSDSNSTTSHTSSIGTSEFSFKADFSQMDEASCNDLPSVAESNNSGYNPAHFVEKIEGAEPNSRSRPVRVETDSTSAKMIPQNTPNEVSYDKPIDIRTDPQPVAENLQANQLQYGTDTQPSSEEGQLSTHDGCLRTNTEEVFKFRPILAGSSHQGQMIQFDNGLLGSSGLAKKNGMEYSHPLVGIGEVPFDELGDPYRLNFEEEPRVFEELQDVERIASGDELGYDVYIKQGIYSFDQSNFLSEVTDTVTVSSADALMYPAEDNVPVWTGTAEENVPEWRGIPNESVCRKAECIVVHDTHLNESGVPSSVREMWVQYYAMKRLGEEHAEKFGYKDFLPIHEENEVELQVTSDLTRASF